MGKLEDRAKDYGVLIDAAKGNQKHVMYLGRSQGVINQKTKVFIRCSIHGERSTPVKAICEKEVLCTRCISRSGGKKSYQEGKKLKYSDGRKYLVIQRKGDRVELLNLRYPERSTFTVGVSFLHKGDFRCPVSPSREGSPHYRGVGKHCSRSSPEAHNRWYKMFQRCYFPTSKSLTYKGCKVAEVWWDFQNYAEWFYSNTPSGVDGLQVDKDILLKVVSYILLGHVVLYRKK